MALSYDDYYRSLTGDMKKEYDKQRLIHIKSFIEGPTKKKGTITRYRNIIKALEQEVQELNKEIEVYISGEKSILFLTNIYGPINEKALSQALFERELAYNDLVKFRNSKLKRIEEYQIKLM